MKQPGAISDSEDMAFFSDEKKKAGHYGMRYPILRI